jgi:hypothetical protein
MDNVSEYINLMTGTPAISQGYDVIIVSASGASEASYWHDRLHSSRGAVSNRDCLIYSVDEDWNSPNGAGNLLGTLYAWKKADSRHRDLQGRSLMEELKSGKSIAMYHIAGLGTRMAPLPGAEGNSKSGIRLPRLIEIEGANVPITIMEAVILQTGPFARSRKGRLSVWWGDQVFIPSAFDSPGTHHAEILAKPVVFTRDIENYGLLFFALHGDARQREKMPFDEICELLASEGKTEDCLALSLGSFSISSSLLAALLEEYSCELSGRTCRLNSDGDLWQPLTSMCEEYVKAGRSKQNWERVRTFWDRFRSEAGDSMRDFGYLNIGDAYWWDYGQLKLYRCNLLKMLSDDAEGRAVREFFGYGDGAALCNDSKTGSACVSRSIIQGSAVRSGAIENSIVINSTLNSAEICDSIVMESTVMGHLEGKSSITYRDLEEGDLYLDRNEVSCGIVIPPAERLRMRVKIDANGKEHWKEKILDNRYSFAELREILKDVDRNRQIEAQDSIRKEILRRYCY